MKNKSLVAINDLSRDEIVKILNLAEEFEKIQFRTPYAKRWLPLFLRTINAHPPEPSRVLSTAWVGV